MEIQENQQMDIEKLLAEGNLVQMKTQGWSMYPLIVDGRDSVVIEPVDVESLTRGDVVLYRRDKGILVLHRIWKCTAEGFYLVGDNQTEIEGPLRPEQMRGRMIRLIRKGREISVDSFGYKVCTGVWLWLRPCRPVIGKAIHIMKGVFHGINNIRKK